nr:ADP-heptose-LPS heptosyltransferase II modular protein [uncultured bacterium]
MSDHSDLNQPSPLAPRPSPRRIVIVAPNWLGDAVLALPAMEAVRRARPDAQLTIAARRSIADVFTLVPWAAVLPLQSDARWWRRAAFRADVEALRSFDAVLLLPNSFQSAWMVKAAGIAERWGYASDARRRLLTRAVPRSRGGHQAEYYQRLVAALDMPAELVAPQIDVPDATRTAAGELLEREGHRRGVPLVVLAPGAAYGKAKQWIPSHVAALIAKLAGTGVTCALVGSRADRPTVNVIRADLADRASIDLVGRTSLQELAGVLAIADACVCNDSGAMHLAAAVGAPVVATFGPTNEHATRPLPRQGRVAEVLTHEVWCRPCMLRECPIDHRCMSGITPDRVFAAVAARVLR